MAFAWHIHVGTGRPHFHLRFHGVVPWRDLVTPEAFVARIISKLTPIINTRDFNFTVEGNQVVLDITDEALEDIRVQYSGGAQDVVRVELYINEYLGHLLKWRQRSYYLPTRTEVWPHPIPDYWYREEDADEDEEECAAPPPPPPPPAPPRVIKEPVNLFIEGVETALCEKGELKPFVRSLVLDNDMGGVVLPRPYHTPLLWRNWSCHEIKTLYAWVEDDKGNVLLFDPDSTLACEITWRAWTRDSPEIADELEGNIIVTFEGSEGQWDMGGTRDFSGVTRKDEEAPSYEVAVLSATVTMRPSPGLISIQAEDWLYPPSDLVTLPCREGNVFMFDPPVPHYKKIRPVPVDHTRFSVRPVYLHENPSPYEIISTKLVLRIRRCRTKLVPSCRGPSCSP